MCIFMHCRVVYHCVISFLCCPVIVDDIWRLEISFSLEFWIHILYLSMFLMNNTMFSYVYSSVSVLHLQLVFKSNPCVIVFFSLFPVHMEHPLMSSPMSILRPMDILMTSMTSFRSLLVIRHG